MRWPPAGTVRRASPDVLRPVLRIGEEVKHGPVVPDVETAHVPDLGHVGRDPFDPAGTLAESRPGLTKRGLRDIEDRDSLEGKFEEPIDQDRRPAAHVDDSSALGLERPHR